MRIATWLIGIALAVGSISAKAADESLIDALRDRLETAEAVAKAKHNSGAPVEDRAREKQVIDNAIHMGVNMGIDADLTLRVFAAQIEASKTAQRAFLKRWENEPKFADAPDLAKTVRPVLDRLTPLILQGLKVHQPWPKDALKLGPTDRAYREAWREAIRPFSAPTPLAVITSKCSCKSGRSSFSEDSLIVPRRTRSALSRLRPLTVAQSNSFLSFSTSRLSSHRLG